MSGHEPVTMPPGEPGSEREWTDRGYQEGWLGKLEAEASRAGFLVGLIVGAIGYPILIALFWAT